MKFLITSWTKTGDDLVFAVEAEDKQAAEKVFRCPDLVIDRVFTLDEFWEEHKVIQIK
jgi:hypothetical protein